MSLNAFEYYIHNDVSINTVTAFLTASDSPARNFAADKVGFLNYDGGTGKSNLDRIYERYTYDEKQANPKSVTIELLKVNTELLVEKTQYNKELLSIAGKNQFLEQSNFSAFYAESLLQLLSDPLYTQNFKYKYRNNEKFTSVYPHISVWIYVGALDKILNITPFVIACSTSMSKTGGSFSLTLPAIVDLEKIDVNFNDDFYSSNFINDGNGKITEFYLHKYLQANDIVFIKFEKLQIEKPEIQKDFILNKSVLPNQFYDMIGLIDTNSVSTNFQGNEVSISVTGRDFMKLFQDDGSYFIPIMFCENSEDLFINVQDDNKLLKRTFTSGAYDYLFTHEIKNITTNIQYIINQLSNLGIVDESIDLFASYGDRRTSVYRLDGTKDSGYTNSHTFDIKTIVPQNKSNYKKQDSNLSDNLHSEPSTGVWQIVKLLVDESISDRRICDASSSMPDNSLMVQMQKLCQDPFVEFFGDTYGDLYNIIVRQPPFTESQIFSALNGIINSKGTITDQKDSLNLPNPTIKSYEADLLLSIEPTDILSQDIRWENEQIYSWFEIKPQGNFIGGNNNISLAYIPIVYFPQYANKWGSRKLSYVSNYISAKSFEGKDSDNNKDYTKTAILNDYKYIIDSFVYLPFTRNCTVVLNGDRRFKIGTWIHHKGTGEIYYVTNVVQSFQITTSSIERTTTLTLTRGMFEKYLKGDITYFNIVNTQLITQQILKNITTGTQTTSKSQINVKSDFGVNQDVFDFFYQRRQMDDYLNKQIETRNYV
jgi:hypothetical protein